MAVIFISSDDLANYIGRTVETDKAGIALDSACDILRKEAGQNYDYVEDDTALVWANGLSGALLLPEMPVYSVSSVTKVGLSGGSDTDLVVDDNYIFDEEMGAVFALDPANPFSKGRYSLTYTHGYVVDSGAPGLPANVQEYPSSLRMLALQLASRIYDQGLVLQETVGSYVAIYSAREAIVLTEREKSQLERAVGVGRRR